MIGMAGKTRRREKMTQELSDIIRDGAADIQAIFEHVAPKSEKTLIRHQFKVEEYEFVNDLGRPCDYRIVNPLGKDVGIIKYYGGRLLCYYRNGYSWSIYPPSSTV